MLITQLRHALQIRAEVRHHGCSMSIIAVIGSEASVMIKQRVDICCQNGARIR